VTLTFSRELRPVIERHEIFVDDGPALEHVFLTPADPAFGGFLGNTYVLALRRRGGEHGFPRARRHRWHPEWRGVR